MHKVSWEKDHPSPSFWIRHCYEALPQYYLLVATSKNLFLVSCSFECFMSALVNRHDLCCLRPERGRRGGGGGWCMTPHAHSHPSPPPPRIHPCDQNVDGRGCKLSFGALSGRGSSFVQNFVNLWHCPFNHPHNLEICDPRLSYCRVGKP